MTAPELITRLREASEKVTRNMIKGWFKKSDYIIPGEPSETKPADPNKGKEDRSICQKMHGFKDGNTSSV
jgi:hypothetical protein